MEILVHNFKSIMVLNHWLSNWFSLRCLFGLGLFMNHLPPVWWFYFQVYVSKRYMVCTFVTMEWDFLLILIFHFILVYMLPIFKHYSSSPIILFWIFFMLKLCAVIFHRRSIYFSVYIDICIWRISTCLVNWRVMSAVFLSSCQRGMYTTHCSPPY